MALPANLTTVAVSGTYVDISGNPVAGQIKFTPRAILKDPDADMIIVPKVVSITLDETGSFAVILPVTDDPDVLPTGWTYYVEEAFPRGRSYDIELPSGGSINLADVAPAVPSTGEGGSDYVLLSIFNTLVVRVEALETTVDTVAGIIDVINAAAQDADDAAVAATAAAASAAEALSIPSPFLLIGVT